MECLQRSRQCITLPSRDRNDGRCGVVGGAVHTGKSNGSTLLWMAARSTRSASFILKALVGTLPCCTRRHSLPAKAEGNRDESHILAMGREHLVIAGFREDLRSPIAEPEVES